MSRNRTWTVWLLLFALPFLGASGVVAGLLGTKHSHSASGASAEPSTALEDVRRLSHRGAPAAPRHGHTSWLRHHHAQQQQADAVALDTALQDSAPSDSPAAGAAAVALAAGPPPGVMPGSVSAVTGSWPRQQASRVDRVAAQPLDRPPKA